MPRAFAAGDTFSFNVNYHGVPATGILIANNRHGDRGWVTNPWPNKARNFRAVIDHPSMKATHTTSASPRRGSIRSCRTDCSIEETDLPGDLRRTVWKESVPISTWLMSLAVAPFAVDHFGSYRGIALSSWVFPQEREAGLKAFAAHTQPVLEFFIDRIGPYPYEKLAQVQANGVGGGMELASSIFYGYGAAGAGRQLIAHEMAHQYLRRRRDRGRLGRRVAERGIRDVLRAAVSGVRGRPRRVRRGRPAQQGDGAELRDRQSQTRPSSTTISRTSAASSPTTRRFIRAAPRCCRTSAASSARRRSGRASGRTTAAT